MGLVAARRRVLWCAGDLQGGWEGRDFAAVSCSYSNATHPSASFVDLPGLFFLASTLNPHVGGCSTINQPETDVQHCNTWMMTCTATQNTSLPQPVCSHTAPLIQSHKPGPQQLQSAQCVLVS